MIPYPPTLNSAPIRSLATALGEFSSSLETGAGSLIMTAQSVASAWTGKGAGAFQESLGQRSKTISSTAKAFASAAAPLQTFAAAIDTTRAQHQVGVGLEMKGYALLSNPYTAALGKALIAKGLALQSAMISAVYAAGTACKGALVPIELKIAAAMFLGVDAQQFESIRGTVTAVWGSVSSVFGGENGEVPDQSQIDVSAEMLRAEQALQEAFDAVRPDDMCMSGGSRYTQTDLTVYEDAPSWMPGVGTAGSLGSPDGKSHGVSGTSWSVFGGSQTDAVATTPIGQFGDSASIGGREVGYQVDVSSGGYKVGSPNAPSFTRTPGFELDPDTISGGAEIIGSTTSFSASGGFAVGTGYDRQIDAQVTLDGTPVVTNQTRVSAFAGAMAAGSASGESNGRFEQTTTENLAMVGGTAQIENRFAIPGVYENTIVARGGATAGGDVSSSEFVGENAEGNWEYNAHAGVGAQATIGGDVVGRTNYFDDLVTVTGGIGGSIGPSEGAAAGVRIVAGDTEVGFNVYGAGHLGLGGSGEFGLSVNPERAQEVYRDYVAQPLDYAGEQVSQAYDSVADSASQAYDNASEAYDSVAGSASEAYDSVVDGVSEWWNSSDAKARFEGGGGSTGGGGASGSW